MWLRAKLLRLKLRASGDVSVRRQPRVNNLSNRVTITLDCCRCRRTAIWRAPSWQSCRPWTTTTKSSRAGPRIPRSTAASPRTRGSSTFFVSGIGIGYRDLPISRTIILVFFPRRCETAISRWRDIVSGRLREIAIWRARARARKIATRLITDREAEVDREFTYW